MSENRSALHSLTVGSISKNMLFFSLPLVCTNLLQVLFNMVDIAVVGKFAGTTALGAVGSTPQLIFLFTGLLMGLGSGVNVVTAYYIGAKDRKSVGETVHTGFLLCLATGLLLLFVGGFFGRTILSTMNTKADLIEDAVLYFRIYMISMPAASLYNFGNAIFSATGDTKKPLYFLLASGLVNVVLDLVFVIPLGMGVAGVALATVISQYISAFLVISALFRAHGHIRLCFSHFRIEKSKLRRLVAIGIPAGLQNAIFAFANVFVQIGVNSFDSIMVAGNSASANVDPLIYNVMAAFYVACATFIGQNYGAQNKSRVKNSYLIATFFAFFVAFVLGGLLFIFGRDVMSLFSSDSAVISAALHRVKIMAFSYCVSAFMDNSIAACRGLGKTFLPSIFVFLGSCVFRIAWIYTVFAYFGTIEALFLLYIFSWGITGIFEIAYFIHIFKKVFK